LVSDFFIDNKNYKHFIFTGHGWVKIKNGKVIYNSKSFKKFHGIFTAAFIDENNVVVSKGNKLFISKRLCRFSFLIVNRQKRTFKIY
jgi:hypothetical protein